MKTLESAPLWQSCHCPLVNLRLNQLRTFSVLRQLRTWWVDNPSCSAFAAESIDLDQRRTLLFGPRPQQCILNVRARLDGVFQFPWATDSSPGKVIMMSYQPVERILSCPILSNSTDIRRMQANRPEGGFVASIVLVVAFWKYRAARA